jgi:hypothetical protein
VPSRVSCHETSVDVPGDAVLQLPAHRQLIAGE